MDYKTQTLPKSEIEIEINIPFVEFEPQVLQAAQKISDKTEISGFRRGKAPAELVEKKVGNSSIYEEAADLAVRATYGEVLKKIIEDKKEKGEDFTPIGRPEIIITKLAPKNEFSYKIKLALLPPIVLPDYKSVADGILKEKKKINVEDKEVEETLKWIRESRAPSIAVNRPAQKGDRVEIDFETRLDGIKLEKGESRDHPVILGEGNFLPGFEDAVSGMKSGEEKEFSLSAPDNWHDKNMAGKKIDFKAKMKSVQERKVPELTDEFAKSLGKFTSVEQLRINVKEGLTKEKEEKEKQLLRAKILDSIAQNIKVEVPEVLIHSEQDKMLGELRQGIEEMNMSWKDYLAHIGKIPEELKKGWAMEAEKRVKTALVLREIARKEKIEADEDKIKEITEKMLARFHTMTEANKNIEPQELREYAEGIVKNEKVFELLEKNTIEENK